MSKATITHGSSNPSKQKDLPGVPPTLDGTIDGLVTNADHARNAIIDLARSADGKMPLVILANAYRIAAAVDKLTAQLNSLRPE